MALSVFNQNYGISSFFLGLHYIMAVSGDTRSAASRARAVFKAMQCYSMHTIKFNLIILSNLISFNGCKRVCSGASKASAVHRCLPQCFLGNAMLFNAYNYIEFYDFYQFNGHKWGHPQCCIQSQCSPSLFTTMFFRATQCYTTILNSIIFIKFNFIQ